MFLGSILTRGAFIASGFPIGCADQVALPTIADAYEGDGAEVQPDELDGLVDIESEPTVDVSDTEDQSDSDAQSDGGVRVVEDNCEVVDGVRCEEDCMPLYSSNKAQTYCAVAGVFFGCVPGLDTGFWPTGDVLTTGQYAVCDVLRDDPKQYLYCFEETFGLYWYYRHMDEGWCQGECVVSPDAAPCE